MKYNLCVGLFMTQCYDYSLTIINKLLNSIPSSNKIFIPLKMLQFEVLFNKNHVCLTDNEKANLVGVLSNILKTIEDKVNSEPSLLSAEFKFRLNILYAKLNAVSKNLDGFKSYIKNAIEINDKEIVNSKNNGSSAISHWLPTDLQKLTITIYCKATMSYLKSNYSRCSNFLENSLKIGGPINYIYNGLGLINFINQKYSLGIFYFQKAISKTSNPEYFSEIYYNMGLSYLRSKKPKDAFKCFMGCGNRYIKRPRFWIRLGECCIENYNTNLKKRDLTVTNKIIENENSIRYYICENDKNVNEECFNTNDEMSLASAIQYFLNSYYLIQNNYLKENNQNYLNDINYLLYISLSKLSYIYTSILYLY